MDLAAVPQARGPFPLPLTPLRTPQLTGQAVRPLPLAGTVTRLVRPLLTRPIACTSTSGVSMSYVRIGTFRAKHDHIEALISIFESQVQPIMRAAEGDRKSVV